MREILQQLAPSHTLQSAAYCGFYASISTILFETSSFRNSSKIVHTYLLINLHGYNNIFLKQYLNWFLLVLNSIYWLLNTLFQILVVVTKKNAFEYVTS